MPPLFFCDIASDSQGLVYKVIASIRELVLYASAVNLCCLVLDRYMAVVKPLKYLTFMKRRLVIQMISFSWKILVIFTVLVRSLKYSAKINLINNIAGWFYTVFELLSCAILISFFASMLSIVCKHDRSARALAKQLRFNHHILRKTQEKSVVVSLFLVC